MPNTTGQLRIGCSGYQYDHWRGLFYPPEGKKKDWFEYYPRHFDTVEINNTFYRVPAGEVFERWRKHAPPRFTFALKFSRFGTHNKKLTDPADTIGYFLERAGRLGRCMGPILVQLPPKWKVNADRLAAFLQAAPRRHRWAVEMRQPSWLCEEVYSVLRRHNAALCIHDILPDHPWKVTADWLYLRYHGVRYGGSYTGRFLAGQATKIRRCLAAGQDVYAYFNNDIGGHAVRNAVTLRQKFRGH